MSDFNYRGRENFIEFKKALLNEWHDFASRWQLGYLEAEQGMEMLDKWTMKGAPAYQQEALEGDFKEV